MQITPTKRMVLVSGRANLPLAEEIAEKLDQPLGEPNLAEFANGELHTRFGAPGDFARAYVIAHEVGHHVQNETGIAAKVHQSKQQLDQESANALSVRQELQADCFSGVWAHYAKQKNVVEPGDIEAALNAASQIGDDRLQMEQKGYVAPESFTHGSSEQRARWFRTGYESGDVNRCDTFNVRNL